MAFYINDNIENENVKNTMNNQNISLFDKTTEEEIPDVIKTTNLYPCVPDYEKEWREIVLCEDPELENLRANALQGNLKTSKFRSICWALLLNVLPHDSQQWVKIRNKQREWYRNLKAKYCINPHTLKDNNDDPLSQSKQSIWNQHFCDQELRSVISQDVVRTFPGVEFFRKPHIQELMKNILFCYAREHPSMCYRQGMHEILAPVIFVLNSDHQALAHITDMNISVDALLKNILNADSLEEDSFTIFGHIMQEIQCFYKINDLIPTSTGYFPASPYPPNSQTPETPNVKEIEIVEQLNVIRDKILAKEDLHLHNHLLKLDISLPLFGIRWLRLLFGREFPLQDLLVLWDAIFAEGDHLKLTNYIVVSMLIRIREKLLTSDYTTCLTLLMRYPNNVDITLIIQHALYMKSPDKYPRPDGVFIYISTQKPMPAPNYLLPQKASTLPRQFRQKSGVKLSQNNINYEQMKKPIEAAFSCDSYDERERSSSLTGNSQSFLSLNGVPNPSLRIVESQHGRDAQDAAIIEGYLENDPEVMRMELQHAFNIMTISRMKLLKYITVLRKHIPGNAIDDANQALDGMEELCSLLKSRYNPPFMPITTAPVEPALEADEGQQKSPPPPPSRAIHLERQITPPNTLNFANIDNAQLLRRRMTEKQVRNEFCRGAPIPIIESDYDFKKSNDSKRGQKNKETRYEIPDNKVSRTIVKIIGNRQLVELREIKNKSKSSCDEHETGCLPLADPQRERQYSDDLIDEDC